MGLHLPKRVRRAALGVVAISGLLLVSACSTADTNQIKRLAMPEPASNRAPYIYHLWQGAWIAALCVGVLVWGLIGYAAFKFRRRSDDEIPVQTRYNLPIEILYTVFPVIMVVVFFYFTVNTQDKVRADVPHVDHTVHVVGEQWSWTFNYVRDPALNGRTTVFDSGTPAYRPTLVLPVNKSVKFVLTSSDVIHSFWVPAFLEKMDVIPGRRNSFELTPTRLGRFDGRCAELCGTYHSRMLFSVRVVTAPEYARYLRGLEAKGNTGLALGGSEVTKVHGLVNKVQKGKTSVNGAGQ